MESPTSCDRRLFVLGLAALAGGAAVSPSPADAKAKDPSTDATKDAAFCMAYAMRDGEKGDVRPEAESVLLKSGLLDIATFAARIVAQARLTDEQAGRVADAVAKGKGHREKAVCYMPHHLFVFYSASGRPLGCIEVCFICSQVQTAGPIPVAKAPNIFIETADLETIRNILIEAKLPLAPGGDDEVKKAGQDESAEEKK
jgi:hypothetical protein